MSVSPHFPTVAHTSSSHCLLDGAWLTIRLSGTVRAGMVPPRMRRPQRTARPDNEVVLSRLQEEIGNRRERTGRCQGEEEVSGRSGGV